MALRDSAPSGNNKAPAAFGSGTGLGSLTWAPIFDNMSFHLLLLKMPGLSRCLCSRRSRQACVPGLKGDAEVEGILLPAQPWHPAPGLVGHPTTPPSLPQGQLKKPSSLWDHGLFAAVTFVEFNYAVMESLFRDQRGQCASS